MPILHQMKRHNETYNPKTIILQQIMKLFDQSNPPFSVKRRENLKYYFIAYKIMGIHDFLIFIYLVLGFE